MGESIVDWEGLLEPHTGPTKVSEFDNNVLPSLAGGVPMRGHTPLRELGFKIVLFPAGLPALTEVRLHLEGIDGAVEFRGAQSTAEPAGGDDGHAVVGLHNHIRVVDALRRSIRQIPR